MNSRIRNIAIIAHVDHGKTTLVDAMLRQSGTFRANEAVVERVMDSNELERERGITILAKNTAIFYHDVKINIVDTPGHSDFGGEVERALKMVDGVMLLVDASEGPLPQTRYVLSKALEAETAAHCGDQQDRPPGRAAAGSAERDLRSVHRPRCARKISSIFPCFIPTPKPARLPPSIDVPGENLQPLFEPSCKRFQPPEGDAASPLQILVANLDYSDYLGRLAIARVFNGTLRTGEEVGIAKLRWLAAEERRSPSCFRSPD